MIYILNKNCIQFAYRMFNQITATKKFGLYWHSTRTKMYEQKYEQTDCFAEISIQ